ncbi:MAG: hypothetical protein R2755_08895 [Acidimicrobiales bacterium]
MLNPSIAELLDAMADALRDTVLPALPPGPAADQVRDAVALTRRIAHAVPRLHAYLAEDGADLARTLDALDPRPDGVARSASWPAEAPPDAEALRGANLLLREELAQLIASGPADASVRALLHRMVEREEALRLSPWARLPRA